MISTDVIEEVRRLVDAVAVIGGRVQLRKSGSSYVGCCPFHEEKQGSFRVYPEDKHFMCFGCGARGDVFDFFQRLDGKPFPAVVRELAAGVGVAVPAGAPVSAEERRAKAERAGLFVACEAAATHWQERLWGGEGEPARHYLTSRGVSEGIARTFRLGYALPRWHDLQAALRVVQVSFGDQHAAGLLGAKDDPGKGPRYYDRFRDRIMFAIEDAAGRVIGFGGRAIGAEDGAKYLNGPETLLYKKARALYGIHQARDAIRKTGRAVLVEGYFDVVALHQAGVTTAVACCGTALSREQVDLLKSAGCRELVLLFDDDEAGAAAPVRAAPAVLEAGLTASVARLGRGRGGGTDPDSLVRRGGRAAVEQVLTETVPLTEYLIDRAMRIHATAPGQQAPVENKLRAVRELTPFVLAAQEGLARSTFVKTIARRLDLDIGPLRHEVQSADKRAAPQSA